MSKRKFLLLNSSAEVTNSKEEARHILVEACCRTMPELMYKIRLTLKKFGVSAIYIAKPRGIENLNRDAIILISIRDDPNPIWINASYIPDDWLKDYIDCGSKSCWFK